MLRNLKLREDALKGFGGVLSVDDDDDAIEEEDWGGDSSDTSSFQHQQQQQQAERAVVQEIQSAMKEMNINSSSTDSDDDSFRSCASHIDSDDEVDETPKQTADFQRPQHSTSEATPHLQIVHGTIGSLELHIPWKLLRATANSAKKSNGDSDTTTTAVANGEEVLAACSAVLSDVRILLAPSNHTRARARRQYNEQQQSANSRGFYRQQPMSTTTRKEQRQRKLDEIRKERELTVQSLLERELLRRARRSNVESGNTDSEESQNKESWLARWAKGLVARILSSLKVTVKNIHIRYEDEGCGWFDNTTTTTNQQQQRQRRQYRPAFSVGMRLEHFSIRNKGVDEEAPSLSIDKSDTASLGGIQLHHKVATVQQLAVYWDSSHEDLFVGYSTPTSEDDGVYYERRFEELDILSSDATNHDDGSGCGDSVLQHRYLIHPISPSLHLTMKDRNVQSALSPSPSTPPSIGATLSIPSCHIGFDRNTLEDVAYLRKCFATASISISSFQERRIERLIAQRLSSLRPLNGIRPLDNPRLWWRYAIRAVQILQSSTDGRSLKKMRVTKKQSWQRKGWLGLSRLLRLRKEYVAHYQSLWKNAAPEGNKGIDTLHMSLISIEDLLSQDEIVSFRLFAFALLANSSAAPKDGDRQLTPSESMDVDELASGQLSVLSADYRAVKLNQIVQAFESDELHPVEDTLNSDGLANRQVLEKGESSPMWAVSLACKEFIVQANDAPPASNAILTITQQSLQQTPIVRLRCSFASRFDNFCEGSWDLSCTMRTLTVSDLIGHNSIGGRTVVGWKHVAETAEGRELSALEQYATENSASIRIRSVIRKDASVQFVDNETNATTYIDFRVSPLEIVYSTSAFEALSRLFATVKTHELSRDYERISQALSRWRFEQRRKLMAVLALQKKFIVSVDIAAPVLVIPEDLQNLDCPTLVIDFGHLHFSNDSNAMHSTEFDDCWVLRLSNVRALCTGQSPLPDVSDTTISEQAIIDPFSLDFSICTHIAKISSEDTTNISVKANLPMLSFNLTSSAVNVVSRLRNRWNYIKAKNSMERRKFSLEDILLPDRLQSANQRGITNLFSSSTEKTDVATTETAVTPKSQLTFTFSAPVITLQISNDVGFEQPPSNALRNVIPLIKLSIRGIRGMLESQSDGIMSSSYFSAHLRSLYARDMTKTGNHICHFVSSDDPSVFDDNDAFPYKEVNTSDDDDDDDDETLDLVVVQSHTKANGDNEVTINFHELYVQWNPEMLARVQASLRLPPEGKVSSMNTVNVGGTTPQMEYFDALDEVSPAIGTVDPVGEVKRPAPAFKISFHLSKLRVAFNKDYQHRCLFTAVMNQTYISFQLKSLGGSIISATVADAKFLDPDNATGGTLYDQIIGLTSTGASTDTSSIVQLAFESFPIDSKSIERDYDNLMKMEFSEMKFVYINQLWLEIFDYYFEGMLGSALWGSKPKIVSTLVNLSGAALSDVATLFKRTKFTIHMAQPLLILPVCYRSPQHIRLQMGSFKAHNLFTADEMKREDDQSCRWTQWFNNCTLEMNEIDVRNWEGQKLNEVLLDSKPPSLVCNCNMRRTPF